jgi:hypothetical protein
VKRSPLNADAATGHAGKCATGLRSPATDAQVPAETPPICHWAEAGADVDIVNITVIGIGELDLQVSRLSASYHGTVWGTTPLASPRGDATQPTSHVASISSLPLTALTSSVYFSAEAPALITTIFFASDPLGRAVARRANNAMRTRRSSQRAHWGREAPPRSQPVSAN